MELEVVEGSCSSSIQPRVGDVEPAGCPPGGFLWGCCIIHYWCWESGQGLCC